MNKEEIREDLTDRGLIFGIMPDNQGVINIDEAINYIHNLVENLSLGDVIDSVCDDWIHEERVKCNDDNYCPICGKKLKAN